MEIRIVSQGLNEPPKLVGLAQPIIDCTKVPKLTFCIVEEGMSSGEPSVMIACETEQGSFVFQTSLDKYLFAAVGMVTAAMERWGWEQPEGYATIAPPDKEARKAMLESIKKELEEWEDVEDA